MNDSRRNKLPISVADILVEDILDLSDDEVMSEAQAKFDDVETEISKTRNIINSTVRRQHEKF